MLAQLGSHNVHLVHTVQFCSAPPDLGELWLPGLGWTSAQVWLCRQSACHSQDDLAQSNDLMIVILGTSHKWHSMEPAKGNTNVVKCGQVLETLSKASLNSINHPIIQSFNQPTSPNTKVACNPIALQSTVLHNDVQILSFQHAKSQPKGWKMAWLQWTNATWSTEYLSYKLVWFFESKEVLSFLSYCHEMGMGFARAWLSDRIKKWSWISISKVLFRGVGLHGFHIIQFWATNDPDKSII